MKRQIRPIKGEAGESIESMEKRNMDMIEQFSMCLRGSRILDRVHSYLTEQSAKLSERIVGKIYVHVFNDVFVVRHKAINLSLVREYNDYVEAREEAGNLGRELRTEADTIDQERMDLLKRMRSLT